MDACFLDGKACGIVGLAEAVRAASPLQDMGPI